MKENQLTPKQAIFVKKLSEGRSQFEATKLAGYQGTKESLYSQGSRLIRNIKIVKALETVGLTDKSIARGIKTNVQAGMGIKATADTSLRGLELASKLKGYLDRPEAPQSLSQTNIYIRELQQLTDTELTTKVNELTKEVKKLKS